MKETLLRYVDRDLSSATMILVEHANRIIDRYDGAMTLRQLYYQLVTENVIPNVERSYRLVGDAVNAGRMAGLISWTAIEDRTRFLRGLTHHDSVANGVRHLRESFRRDLWEGQPFRPEVWIEKDALIGVIEPICHELRVDYYACRGYSSQSEAWRAGQRFAQYVRIGQRPIVFHLGDHDPSGLDMTRDNRDRLELFTGVPVQVVRLALNRSQVDEMRLVPNPAKVTDPRADAYRRVHGDVSWELDALTPTYLRTLVRDSVVAIRDGSLWDEALGREAVDLRELDDLVNGL